MEIKEFLELLSRKKQTVLSIMLLFVLLTAVLMSFQHFKYEAKSRILLLQHNGEAMDPYNAAKSNQFISSLLASVVSSNAFLNDVFGAGFNIDESYFGNNTYDKLNKWQKTADARAINDTGIIEINTYHTDKTQAEQINSAIINVIKTKNGAYYGRNEDISIKVIDEPIISDWPVRPNILLNLALTIFISLLISFSYIVLFQDEKYDLSVWPKRKKKHKIAKVEKINFADKIVEDKPEIKTEFVPKVNNFHERGNIKNIFDQSNTK
jgi:capsular polysaccharide biosynthesis protein